MQNTWHQKLLHDNHQKQTIPKKTSRFDRSHWTLPVELHAELQHTCPPLEQHRMIGKGCGYFGRKEEQGSAASPALKAGPGGCSWATPTWEMRDSCITWCPPARSSGYTLGAEKLPFISSFPRRSHSHSALKAVWSEYVFSGTPKVFPRGVGHCMKIFNF